MKLLPALFVLATCCASMVHAPFAEAQQPRAEASDGEHGKQWYYGSRTPVVVKKSIAQQKAQAKAQQRIARLEALRWLGASPGRPYSTVIPFTSSNSLDWKKSQRSRYVWYTSLRPHTYVVRPYYGFY
ncbi:MAG: hypothetical protein MI725_01375 [Pirellulales bacterium]|nr:hypothetical protein [Pirellulales bacterium]